MNRRIAQGIQKRGGLSVFVYLAVAILAPTSSREVTMVAYDGSTIQDVAADPQIHLDPGTADVAAEIRSDGATDFGAISGEVIGFQGSLARGVRMIGWGGTPVTIPFVITGSSSDLKCPEFWPYTDADFKRQDERNDGRFYRMPRLVTHIDDGAINAIKNFYAIQFDVAPQGDFSVLDICSSWVSHYPSDLKAKRVAVTGMVADELAQNPQATEYVAKDLNKDPVLAYGNAEFDFVTNVVSIDYITKPQEIFREMHRVLKPGGVAIISYSNRCFANKAISMWLADMNDGPGHAQIVANYFHFSPVGGWSDIHFADISPNPGQSDPMWVVTAIREI